MEKEESSIEWLCKELESYGDPQFCEIEWKQLDSLIKQAKEMHKQEIIDAWEDGHDSFSTRNAEQYYNETFKNNP